MVLYTPWCKQGYYAYGDGCRECPAGRYGSRPFLAGEDDCTLCPAGKFQTEPAKPVSLGCFSTWLPTWLTGERVLHVMRGWHAQECALCGAGYRSTVVGMQVRAASRRGTGTCCCTGWWGMTQVAGLTGHVTRPRAGEL